MKKLTYLAVLLLAFGISAAGQEPARPPDAPPARTAEEVRAEAYFNFARGHFYSEQYEVTRRSADASLAIEYFKKAYELDPKSAVIGEELAEIYFKSQRIRDAVLEAQEIIRRDADNLPSRRLLARIYLRTLGDLNPTSAQRETAGRALEQYREILRIDPKDAEAAQWVVRLYRLQNEHDKAETVLRQFLEREPENEMALELLTQLLLDQGRTEEAIELLERIVQRSPTASLLNVLGQAYTQIHKPAKAEAAYQRAIEMEPAEAEHVRGLARTLYVQSRYDEALEQYQRLAKLDPEDPEAYVRMAQIYRQQKKYDRAEESLLRAKERSPGNVELIYHEAMLYEAQGRYDDAIRVLSSAVYALKVRSTRGGDLRRTLGVFYEQLGRLYREVQNFTAAQNTFQELAQLGPDEEKRATELMIDTYRAGKEIDRAIAESEKAMKAYPDDPSVRVTHSMLLGEKGQTDAAAKILQEMLRGTREDRGIYLGLAQVYERGRRYTDAEKAARTAEKMGVTPGENEVAWFLLAAVYERQKKHASAEEYFKKALEVNPRNAAALNYYGYMLAELGLRLDEAVKLVERALEEDPNNGAYLDSLGWAYFKQNRFDLAEQFLNRAAERTGNDPTIHDHLGDVYLKTGRPEMAAKAWERSLAEWRRALPSEFEADKVAELEKKLARLKHRLAQAGQPKTE
jgi:tetratricopeptide (TPR) repeat protein